MSDWIEKNKLNFSGSIIQDCCSVIDASLFLMEIATDSNLGSALKGIGSRIVLSNGYFNQDTVFVGDKLVCGLVKAELAGSKGSGFCHPDRLNSVFLSEDSESSFISLIKEYLKLFDAIQNSTLIHLNNAIGAKPINKVLVTELIEWAVSKNIAINDALRLAYNVTPVISDSDKSLSATNLKKPIPEWIAEAREIGKKWLDEQRKIGNDPNVNDIARHVEDEFKKLDRKGSRGGEISASYIKRQALAGITGKRPNGK